MENGTTNRVRYHENWKWIHAQGGDPTTEGEMDHLMENRRTTRHNGRPRPRGCNCQPHYGVRTVRNLGDIEM